MRHLGRRSGQCTPGCVWRGLSLAGQLRCQPGPRQELLLLKQMGWAICEGARVPPPPSARAQHKHTTPQNTTPTTTHAQHTHNTHGNTTRRPSELPLAPSTPPPPPRHVLGWQLAVRRVVVRTAATSASRMDRRMASQASTPMLRAPTRAPSRTRRSFYTWTWTSSLRKPQIQCEKNFSLRPRSGTSGRS